LSRRIGKAAIKCFFQLLQRQYIGASNLLFGISNVIGSALPIQDINYDSGNIMALTYPFRRTVEPYSVVGKMTTFDL
jgi:hypothetical protein